MARSGEDYFRALMLTSTAIVSMAVATPAMAQTKNFNVKAQSASKALAALARQADAQILISARDARGKRTNAVRGSMTVEQALQRLLRDSGLRAEATGVQTYTVVPVAGQVAPSTAKTASSSGGTSPAAGEAVTGSAAPGDDSEEIVVTGTNIEGLKSLTSPVLILSREEIERAGYTNTAEIVNSLPQNFGGGEQGATVDGQLGPGSRSNFNAAGATAFNLRGLGADSTLTLINGSRVAAGIRGQAVDVSLIPIAAIKRIDILTDGASAVYGSDAVAGVVNVILRDDFKGVETGLKYGTVTDGGLRSLTIDQLQGTSWQSGSAFLALNYQRQTQLDASDRSFTAEAATPTYIIPKFRQYAGILSVNQEIGNKLEASIDALFSDKSTLSSLTYDSVNGYTTDNNHRQFDLTARLVYRPASDWRVEASGTHSSSRDEVTYLRNIPLPPGIVLGEVGQYFRYRVNSANLRGSGTLVQLPAGPAQIGFGASYNEESLRGLQAPDTEFTVRFDRNVMSAYGELNVPIFDDVNSRPFLTKLVVNGSLRHDRYSDFGSSTNYKVGVLWQPHSDIRLRASWGTSFRAPNAQDVFLSSVPTYIFTYDFAAPNGAGTVPIFVLQGGNPDLKPERSTNWSAGLEYSPAFLPGFRLSATYYNVHFRDRIVEPPFDLSVLQNPSGFGSLIQPLSDDAAAAALLSESLSRGFLYFDLAEQQAGSTGIRYVYNAITQNASSVRQAGLDLGVVYSTDITSRDQIDLNVNGAYIAKIKTLYASGAQQIDLVNTYSNPPKWKLRGSATWSREPFRLTTAINYVNSYKDTSALPAGRIADWLTADINFSLVPTNWSGFAQGLSFNVAITNLFDKDPPYAAGAGLFGGVHYDVGNASALGRFVSFGVRKRW